MTTILQKLFQRLEKNEKLPNSETTLTLMLESDKDIIRKRNYRPTVPMNVDTKILNKILAQKIH